MTLSASQIGARLRRAREGAHLQVGLAARASELTASQLEDAERGVGLTVEVVRRIAMAYGFAEEDLLAGNDDDIIDSAVSVLLRGDPHNDELALHLGRLAAVCREQTLLEELLGQSARDQSPLSQPDLMPFIVPGVERERLGLVRPAVMAYERGLITRGRLLEALGLSPFAEIDALVELQAVPEFTFQRPSSALNSRPGSNRP